MCPRRSPGATTAMKIVAFAAAMLGACALAAPAHAGELYGGVMKHAVDTPFTLDTQEKGIDLEAGYRFDPILSVIKLQPYVFGSVNSDGGTNFVGAGIARKFALGPLYVRPAVGVVVHDGPKLRVDPATGLRTDLGSRVLFEPEIAIGTEIAPRISLEAAWVHISNAQALSDQNPGIDMIGLRANLKL